jgi:hypothetical protein
VIAFRMDFLLHVSRPSSNERRIFYDTTRSILMTGSPCMLAILAVRFGSDEIDPLF